MARHADLKAALQQLPAPEPNPELLQRILRSRSLGRRLTAPSGEAFMAWRWIAAAAVVTLLIGGSWGVSLYLSRLGESGAARDRLEELLPSTKLGPSRDEAATVPREVLEPAYALIDRNALDTSRLTPGVWTYLSETTLDDVLTKPSGGERVRLARATYAGGSAWMLSTAPVRTEGWNRYADTTYLDAGSLRPLRSMATLNKGRTRFVQTFWPDSGQESIDLTGPVKRSWRRGIALPFSRNALFLNGWSTDRLAALFPAFAVRAGWRGSLYQVSFVSRTDRRSAVPLDLRVVGKERVTVPAGTFDCWRLEVEGYVWESERVQMWVSRDKGWLIKEQRRWSDYVVNRVLVSYAPLQ